VRKSATIKHLLQAGYLSHKLLRGSDCLHLHAHFAHSPTSVTLFSSLMSGLSFSFTAHAKDIYTSDPQQLAEKAAAARFIATCTAYNRNYLRTIAPQVTTPIYLNYHGIDLNLFRHIKRDPAAKAPFRILTVARLTPKKGLLTVYRALRLLKDRGVAFRHTLIGDGEQKAEILDWRRALDLEAESTLLGTRPHEDVHRCFQDADLFVLGCQRASNGDRDGIPNVILESLAMGVPVVATHFSAIPEVIRSPTNGLLVEPEQPAAMAEAMLTALTQRELRAQMIANGLQTVRQHFDNRILVAELARLIKRHSTL
jgi:glycosyltransferase involved in cell wall biosynthesis